MKKYILLALTLVLTAALFTGCGCTNQDAMYTTEPTTRPSIATTAPTTQATTASTTEAATTPTADRGNGALEDTIPTDNTETGTSGTTDSTAATQGSRARQMQPTIKQN